MDFVKADWFTERKLGIFVHYGLYSRQQRGEWSMMYELPPIAEYEKLAESFNPRDFDADALAQMAREAGAGYLVLTARHHEGFSLYDTRVSDFNSVHYCGRDLVAEHVNACRKHGLKVGLYYSLLDWRYQGYFNREKYPESFARMVQQAHDQVRELMTNYGKIDYLFFDGGWMSGDTTDYHIGAPFMKKLNELWRADELREMIQTLQPGILTNDRSGHPGDVYTPEQETEASADERYTEACMTIGNRCGWGYIHNNPNMKSTCSVLEYMAEQLSFGGNFLLNVGPMPHGGLRDHEEQVLAELGQWLRTNGEAVYGTTKAPFRPLSICGEFTAKPDTLYFHVLRWPHSGQIVASRIYNKVTSVSLLDGGRELPFTQEENGRLIISELPILPPDVRNTVIKIRYTEEPLPFERKSYGTL